MFEREGECVHERERERERSHKRYTKEAGRGMEGGLKDKHGTEERERGSTGELLEWGQR